MYAEMEEKYGLISHAVEIYNRMVENVPYENKEQAFYIYISKVSNFLGVTKTRTIFEVRTIYILLNHFRKLLIC